MIDGWVSHSNPPTPQFITKKNRLAIYHNLFKGACLCVRGGLVCYVCTQTCGMTRRRRGLPSVRPPLCRPCCRLT